MFKPQQCALLVSLACAGQAYAANVPEFAGDPVIVTAGRVPQKVADVPANVTVVTSPILPIARLAQCRRFYLSMLASMFLTAAVRMLPLW